MSRLRPRIRGAILRAGAWAALAVLAAGCSVNGAKSRYLLAEKLWTDGKYAAAVAEFEKVIQKDPKGKLGLQALYRAGMTQALYLFQYEDAVRKLRQFAVQTPDGDLAWEAQKTVGEVLFAKTDSHESAIQHYRVLLTKKPEAAEAPEFLFRIAKSHFFLWQFDDAIQVFQDLEKRYPDSPWAERAALEIGVTRFTRGEHSPGGQGTAAETYQEAMDSYQRFLRKYPKSRLVPEAKFGIASCLEELDQLDAAYHQFEALLSTYPSPNVIKIKLTRIRQRQTQKGRSNS